MTIAPQLDLCKELVKTLTDYEFTPTEVARITADPLFIDAQGKDDNMQRAILSLMLYRVAVYSNAAVSKNVKLALNATVGSLHWLDNIKLSVVPFIKNNKLLTLTHA